MQEHYLNELIGSHSTMSGEVDIEGLVEDLLDETPVNALKGVHAWVTASTTNRIMFADLVNQLNRFKA